MEPDESIRDGVYDSGVLGLNSVSGSGSSSGNGSTGSGGSNGGCSGTGGGGWLPVGVILPYGANTENPPTGWLYCRGQELKIEEYQDLYSVIGFIYTSKETQGLDTFNLPDFRGMFLRGYDDGAKVDDGREFGTEQASAAPDFQLNFALGGHSWILSEVGIINKYNTSNAWLGSVERNGSINNLLYGASACNPLYNMGITEVRPANYAINYIIKY